MKIAFLLYPLEKIRIEEDTSFWILWEVQRRGHEVYYFESRDLFFGAGAVRGRLTAARLHARRGFLPSPAPRERDLSDMDCVFIRKEPPFNEDYLYALQLLDLIRDRVWIVNDPRSVALCNEKTYALAFPRFIPETLVTDRPDRAVRFIRGLRAPAVLKPLAEKGGIGIRRLDPRDKNLAVHLEMATRYGSRKVLIQRFVPVRKYGDKRILILDGEILGAFLRRPSGSDFRANLSIGGTMHKARLTDQDYRLVEAMRPKLLDRGLYFTGIDVIGEYLIEVNVTSPSGIPEINRFEKTRSERRVADFLENRRRRS